MTTAFGETFSWRHKLPGFLFDVWHFVASPTEEVAVWADYFRTRREMAFLRGVPAPVSGARRFLVISLSTFIYQIKLESILAAGMRAKGWRPVVLVSSRSSALPLRYFRAFGIDDFAYFQDFEPTAEEATRCAERADGFLSAGLSCQTVKEWSFEGSWIGPQILSSLSRDAFRGSVGLEDATVREKVREALPDVLKRVIRAKKAITAVKPHLAMVIEANYLHYGPLVDMAIASGAPVIQAIQPWREDALMLKRLGRETRRMHPSSIAPRTFERVRALPWTQDRDRELAQEFADRSSGKWFVQARNQPNVRDFDGAELIRSLDLDLAKKTVVVFSHVLWDANLFYGEDLFDDLGDWFIRTVAAACANPNANWIVKLHPANIWKRASANVDGEYDEVRLIREHIGDLPDHVKLLFPDTDISSFSLYRLADWVVTVRGTPGMEAPCFGAGAITAGTGRYSGLGFTIDSRTRDEYLDRLARVHELPPVSDEQVLLAKKHAYAVFRFRPWEMKSFYPAYHPRSRGQTPLDHNLHARARSRAELEANGDLAKWADWAADFERSDYFDMPQAGS